MPKIKKSERESPWFKYGTDADYQKWCRTQPCAVTGKGGCIIFAHYRTAANSGVGIKPPFSGIPMEYHEHLRQHQIGQYAYLPRERWEYLCALYLEKWRNSLLEGK